MVKNRVVVDEFVVVETEETFRERSKGEKERSGNNHSTIKIRHIKLLCPKVKIVKLNN